MTDKNYNQPRISINKVYTKKGDKGSTNIVGGHKVDKSSNRIKAFGEIDELNVIVGMCVVDVTLIENKHSKEVSSYLQRIQHELFNLGNMIATLPEDFNEKMPSISMTDIDHMENKIDFFNDSLPTINSFILPGGSELSIRLHFARVVCRSCERTIVRLSKEEDVNNVVIAYLNRLSDLFFVLSRWVNNKKKVKEFLWNPNFKD